ncbi:MAG: XRE family transcriptional regulator [Bradyrhizobium sp.]|jgi:DNA-binding XRE family transcriptional regulator|nr:MAG: XRE family transcriptional regulator [Bradyrhizobium sp.]
MGVAIVEPCLTFPRRTIAPNRVWKSQLVDSPKGEGDAHRARTSRDMKKTKSEIDEYIGSRIREYRLSLRLTQEQLASALKVSFQQVQNYEKGINGISAVRLFDICKILNVPLASMFPPDDPKEAVVQPPLEDEAKRGTTL